MLTELESERRWDELFERSQDLLARMAEEARQEYREGRTEPLDLDKL
jgi:TRAP-type C4-dicarboxylate transport system substrate-binding protein